MEKLKWGGKIGRIKLNRNYHEAGGPANTGCSEEFNIWGTIVFEGTCQIGTGGKITVGDNGKLILGDNCKIMSQCTVTAYKQVEIGRNFLMAHCAQIFDTNYHYVLNKNQGIVKCLGSSVNIGNHCWVCNSSTIMPGSRLPDNAIVASHSLVNKDFSMTTGDCVIAGLPAKVVASGYRRVYEDKMVATINTYFSIYPEATDYSLTEDMEINLF